MPVKTEIHYTKTINSRLRGNNKYKICLLKKSSTNYRHFFNNKGFTLIEIIVVIVIISIVMIITLPRITNFMSNDRENFAILTGKIAKTFDDSFLHDKVNYLAIHLEGTMLESTEDDDTIWGRDNGISVINLENGKFVDNKRKILAYKKFPESFRIEEIILSNGEKLTEGTALVPYYPQGYSDNVIIHILVNDEEQWSLRIYKHLKEPRIIPEYITFESYE